MAEISKLLKTILGDALPEDANVIGIAKETMQAMFAYSEATGEDFGNLMSQYMQEPGEVLVLLDAFTAQQEHGNN
ncbi:MAG: hypothetical protein HN578_22350 [Rhodospirillales bacterium]|jgi:hypothetical protein|nr:hypothetical protein [Rhodospirillales bacterium]